MQQVPDVLNRESADACSVVTAAGYTCDPRPDGYSPTAVVSSQEPPAGTPLASGSAVVVHYSPHNSGVLNRYRSVTQPGVYVIRVDEAAPEGYVLDAYLGRAYPATLTDQPNTAPVFGYMCTASKERCGGSQPNHYFSIHPPDPDLPDWHQTSAVLRVFAAPGGACPQGQVLISRTQADGEHPAVQRGTHRPDPATGFTVGLHRPARLRLGVATGGQHYPFHCGDKRS